MNDIAIKVENLNKTFKLPHEKRTSIKSVFVNFFRRQTYEKQKVLNNISFEIKEGEFFGIIGRNGSGKSTLLKILAGIYTSSSGKTQINGSLTPFIELGVGFNPELTGRENVFLNGALLGFSKKQMLSMYDEIVAFAELERFMDQKLKNYSSGMQVRLAFSIAIRSESDILLLDEVLAVGDELFQKKCFEYFAKLKKEKRTVVLVTHDMDSVQRFCTKAMLLDKSNIITQGTTSTVINKYKELNLNTPIIKQKNGKLSNSYFDFKLATCKKSKINKYIETDKFMPGEKICIQSELLAKESIKNAFIGITIQNQIGETIFWTTTEKPNQSTPIFKKKHKVETVLIIENVFGEGHYSVNLYIKSNDRTKEYLAAIDLINFQVIGRGVNGWMLHPKSSLHVNNTHV